MNISGIEAFLAVVDTQSVSRAAERLFLSQSTVSHRLKLLEASLGGELIDRAQGRRSSTLTARGEAFLPIARRWMTLVHDTEQFKTRSPMPCLNIGSVDSLNQFFLHGLYTNMLDAGVPVQLNIRTHAPQVLYGLMAGNLLDIAFSTEYIRFAGIHTTTLFRERMYLVCHRMALPPGPVHPAVLDPADELRIDWDMSEMQMWHDRWWSPGAAPYVQINAPSFATRFLLRRPCWMVVPASIAHHWAAYEHVTLHDLREPPPRRICYLLRPRHRQEADGEAMTLFLQYLDAYLDSAEVIDREV